MRSGDHDQHPEPARLEAFLRAELSPTEGKSVVAHLLRGCDTCSQHIEPIVRGLLDPVMAGPRVDEAAYDPPIDRALASARRELQALAAVPIEVAPRLAAELKSRRERCDALLARAWELRASDPASMTALARLAAHMADGLGAQDGRPVERADFQARVWAELGNALRISADLHGAERAFAEALARAGRGTGDVLLAARIHDLVASLRIWQGRYREACRLLDGLYQVHFASGDLHLAGRAMIKHGTALLYDNEFAAGRRSLTRGLELIDPRREPSLALSAVHSLLMGAVDSGAYDQAERWIAISRRLYEERGSASDQLKLRWQEGRLAAGRGQNRTAERIFWEVRDEFDGRSLPHEAASVSLDLALLWLHQGRTGEILEIVEEVLEAFRALGVQREAIAALLVLRRALDSDREQAELARLLRRVSGRLKRRERLAL
ncbi:MAG TPA: hypothetical protein VN783_10375 [Thermoanaerobaculia bacterium]|nr:hypothetical protein [Thermoanaerobaculia bacterium]